MVVGAGHNGLVAAFYLARAGRKVLVVERREIVGGACVTEEFAPGYRASTGAYILSMLRPAIWTDLQAARARRGHRRRRPVAEPVPRRRRPAARRRPGEAARRYAASRRPTPQTLPEVEDQLLALAALLVPTFDMTAFNVGHLRRRDGRSIVSLLRNTLRSRKDLDEALFLITASANHYLTERFESPYVRAALGWHSINDSLAGPSTFGTAYVLLHDHVSHETGGGLRRWGFVRGGMGQGDGGDGRGSARGRASRSGSVSGVEQILTTGLRGKDIAVTVCSSPTAPPSSTPAWCSPVPTPSTPSSRCATPADLPGRLPALGAQHPQRRHEHQDQPRPQPAPGGRGPEHTGAQPYHHGVIELGPTLDVLDLQQARARAGMPATGAT